MTRFVERTLLCAICQQESKQLGLASSTSHGSPDLDTRLPPRTRDAVLRTVQQCPHCGYCAQDISTSGEGVVAVVADEAYQRAATDPQVPDLVRKWHCCSLILAATRNLAQAGWGMLCAAWVCDDADLAAAALQWRQSTLALFSQAQEQKQPFAENQEVERAILADLYRRTGDFEAVINLCDQAFGTELSESVAVMLQFQRALAVRQDTTCYTIADAWEHRQP